MRPKAYSRALYPCRLQPPCLASLLRHLNVGRSPPTCPGGASPLIVNLQRWGCENILKNSLCLQQFGLRMADHDNRLLKETSSKNWETRYSGRMQICEFSMQNVAPTWGNGLELPETLIHDTWERARCMAFPECRAAMPLGRWLHADIARSNSHADNQRGSVLSSARNSAIRSFGSGASSL